MTNNFKEIVIGDITLIFGIDLDNNTKSQILEKYNFHQLDKEATLEENQFPRVNRGKDYLFMIFHFPKYLKDKQRYVINEFNIFLGKDFLIIFLDLSSSHIRRIIENIEKKQFPNLHPGYILYKIIEVMLEKMFKVISNLKRDLSLLEREIFKQASTNQAHTILIKKRNIIFLKHTFQPQVMILRQLENEINSFFKGEYELFFEDLEDKIDFIYSQLLTLEERIETIEDAFKNIIDIKLNKLIAILTIFSAFMLPLTLITSFYGMNLPSLPYANKPLVVYGILVLCTIIMIIGVLYLRKKKII